MPWNSNRVTARAVVVIGARETGRNGRGRELQITVGRTYFYEGTESQCGNRLEKVDMLKTQYVPWIENAGPSWGEAWWEVFDLVAQVHQNAPLMMHLVVDTRGLAEGPAWGLQMLARAVGKELDVEVFRVDEPECIAGEWLVQTYGEQMGLFDA